MDAIEKKKPRSTKIVLWLLAYATALFGCIELAKKNPIPIGFVAQLTGHQAELGVQERNGTMLAVEQLNAAGGIDGRKIELLIRDDLGTPENALAAAGELVEAGVVAIIGHATSGQTVAGLKATNPVQTVMISPTVSTPTLSEQDDYFFRVYPSFKESSQAFADYIARDVGVKRLAIVYDVDNAAYAQTYCTTLAERFTSLGSVISAQIGFSSARRPDFSALLKKLRASRADGLFIVASDVDTALIAQKTRLAHWNIPLFTSAWAQTTALISNGGKAVEGMRLEQSFTATSQAPAFREFQNDFLSRFGDFPSFGAAFSYEATMALAEALKKNSGALTDLKKTLLANGEFKGLIDNFSFDRYGDVKRPFYLSVIENGAFISLGKLN